MNTVIGTGVWLFGLFLMATCNWSAELHERWNQKFWWTRWATGQNAMHASRIANVIVSVGLIVFDLAYLAVN